MALPTCLGGGLLYSVGSDALQCCSHRYPARGSSLARQAAVAWCATSRTQLCSLICSLFTAALATLQRDSLLPELCHFLSAHSPLLHSILLHPCPRLRRIAGQTLGVIPRLLYCHFPYHRKRSLLSRQQLLNSSWCSRIACARILACLAATSCSTSCLYLNVSLIL
jgi:hypothetical protein